MKIKIVLLLSILFSSILVYAQDETDYVTISGRVTDYDGNPLDSVSVFWQNEKFDVVQEDITDKVGYYTSRIKKGKYYAMGALNMSKYIVTGSTLPEDELRLEFWSWNFIADRDTSFNMQYHRLEVYGVNVFRIQGATPGYTIYCRPMSLSRVLKDRENPPKQMRMAPDPDNLKVKVTINGDEVPLRMKQEVLEYFDTDESSNAYLLFVDLPKKKNTLPYDIFRIQMEDLENGDKGEAVYFLEKQKYIQ